MVNRRNICALFMVMLLPAAVLASEVEMTFLGKFVNRYTVESSWNVLLINSTQEKLQGRLQVQVSDLEGNPVLTASSGSFELNPGIPFNPMGKVSTQSSRFEQSFYEQLYRNSGALPPGQFKVCLQFLSNADVPMGNVCDELSLFLVSPPIPLMPEEDKVINDINFNEKNPVFSWTPIIPLYQGNTFYKLHVFEIFDGQTAEEAVASNPAYFESEETAKNQYFYPQSARQLQPGKYYAWYVSARLKDARPEKPAMELNAGSGEVRGFSLRTKDEPKDTIKYVMLSRELNQSVVKLGRQDKFYFSIHSNYSVKQLKIELLPISGQNGKHPKSIIADTRVVKVEQDTFITAEVINYYGNNKYMVDLSKPGINPGVYTFIVTLPDHSKLYCKISKD